MAKISKKRQADFVKRAIEILNLVDAKEDTYANFSKCFDMDTIAGPLRITIDEDNEEIFSIFCRFSNPREARELSIDCSLSGKWNFHSTDENVLLKLFMMQLVGIEKSDKRYSFTIEEVPSFNLEQMFAAVDELHEKEWATMALREAIEKRKKELIKNCKC